MKDSLFFAGAVQKSLCVVVLVSHDKIEVVAVLENSFLVLPVARLHDDDDDVVARAGAAATRSTCPCCCYCCGVASAWLVFAIVNMSRR